jgi:hypothetical protein
VTGSNVSSAINTTGTSCPGKSRVKQGSAMSRKPTPQALRIADDGIVAALDAVGETMPAKLRDSLIAASDWCWENRAVLRATAILGSRSDLDECDAYELAALWAARNRAQRAAMASDQTRGRTCR